MTASHSECILTLPDLLLGLASLLSVLSCPGRALARLRSSHCTCSPVPIPGGETFFPPPVHTRSKSATNLVATRGSFPARLSSLSTGTVSRVFGILHAKHSARSLAEGSCVPTDVGPFPCLCVFWVLMHLPRGSHSPSPSAQHRFLSVVGAPAAPGRKVLFSS